MRSLLDLAIMRANPLGAGLLGIGGPQPLTPGVVSPLADVPRSAPTAPEPAEQGEGGFLQRLFAGGNDPNLSPEENERIGKQARVLAGLSILASDKTGVEAVAGGILRGQQGAAASRDSIFAQQERTAKLAREAELRGLRQQVFDNVDLSDPAQRDQAMSALLAKGDFDGAKNLNEFAKTFPEIKSIEVGEQVIFFDPRNGERTGTIKLPPTPPGTAVVDLGDRMQLIVDEVGNEALPAGTVLQTFDKGTASGAVRETMDKTFSRMDKLADDFRTETRELVGAQQIGASALNAPDDDPAGDQTLVVAFNKLLDPGSVVRESEFARVAGIGGFSAQAQAFANRIVAEGQLGVESRASIRAEISRLLEANTAEIAAIGENFRQRATSFGVNPDYVVRPELVDENGRVSNDPATNLANFGGN